MPVREYDKCESENSHQNHSQSGIGEEPWALQDAHKGWQNSLPVKASLL